MKEVPCDKLIVGVVYSDVPLDTSKNATLLRFVERFGRTLHFRYVSGAKGWYPIKDGMIVIGDDLPFYLPTRDQSEFAK